MPRSTDPQQVFTALAGLLHAVGYAVLIEVLGADGRAYRIDNPRPGDAAAAWADFSEVLDAEDEVLSDRRAVGVRISADRVALVGGGFTGALVARRRRGGLISVADAAALHALVQHALGVLTTARVQQQLRAARILAVRLQRAGTQTQDIGVAVGIIMAKTGCTAEQATASLRKVSDATQQQLHRVAANVVRTKVLPPVPGEPNDADRPSS